MIKGKIIISVKNILEMQRYSQDLCIIVFLGFLRVGVAKKSIT